MRKPGRIRLGRRSAASTGRVLPRADIGRLRLKADVDGLCRVLEHADRQSARYAAEFLTDIADPAAAGPLLRCLKKHAADWLLCEAVVQALGRIVESRAVPPLVVLLRDDDPYAARLQRAAISALGETGDTRAAQPLLDAIDRPALADAALVALGRLGDPSAVPEILARLPEIRTAPGIAAAALALGRLRDPQAIPALGVLATDEHMPPRLRRAAITALGQVGTAGAVPPLVLALADPDPVTSATASEMLAHLVDGLPALVDALSSPSPAARRSVCLALGTARERRCFGKLCELLSADRDPAVRRSAATALGRIRQPEGINALLEALGDRRVSAQAANALAEFADPPMDALVALLGRGTEIQQGGAALALGLIGNKQAAGPLLLLLRETSVPAARAAAIDALGRLPDHAAAADLAALIDDADEPGGLRARATRALGLIGGDGASSTLLGALRDPVESVRIRATAALAYLPSRQVAAALATAAADDTSAEVAHAAVSALGRIGKPATPALLSLLQVAKRELQSAVVSQLRHCEPEVIAALTLLVSGNDARLRLAAVNSLAAMRDAQCVEALSQALTLSGYGVREAALQGLALIADDRAVHAVLRYFATEGQCHSEARAAINTIAARGITLEA